MTIRNDSPGGVSRRRALKAAAAAAAVGTGWSLRPTAASAQSLGDIDALNLMLNMEYLLVQFLRASVAAAVDPLRLTGNGVAGVPVTGGRVVMFADAQLQSMVVEMSNDNYGHLVPIRVIIGALSASQPAMDISAGASAPFSVAMQRAGVVGAGVAFDPYASEENFLYALFLLKSISVAAYRGIMAMATNRVVTQNFAGFLGTEAIHASTVRSYLYARGATVPRLRENAEKIAAYLRTLNGGGAFQGVTPASRTPLGGSTSIAVANLAPVQGNGEVAGRSPGQVLNLLYLTSTVATSGGFFPAGVNGTIRSSAGA